MALVISFDSPNFMVLRWTFAFWNSHVSFFIQPFRHFRKAIPAIAAGILPTRPGSEKQISAYFRYFVNVIPYKI